jgi:hypothetical protein
MPVCGRELLGSKLDGKKLGFRDFSYHLQENASNQITIVFFHIPSNPVFSNNIDIVLNKPK